MAIDDGSTFHCNGVTVYFKGINISKKEMDNAKKILMRL